MTRVSSYIIQVELEPDKVMLLHGYSGAMDIVDNATAAKLCSNNIICENDFDAELLNTLRKRGYMTDMSQDEENEYFRRMAVALHKKDMLLYAYYTFIVTYDCNFKCPYCFEREFVKDTQKQFTMTEQMVDKAFEAIKEIQKNKQRECKSITLFGGEPLLKENAKLIDYIVTKGAENGFTFSAITNGYDLDTFAHLLSPDKIRFVQITIDGTEEMHNQKRLHKENIPTFKKIVDNIGIAIRKNINITIRFNTDRNNFAQLTALKEYFDKLGYTKYDKFHIDSARLENYDESLDQNEKQAFLSQKEFIKKHESLNFEHGCHDYHTYSKIYRSIYKQEPLPYKSTFCSSQIGGYVFDPFYKIYPCWEVIGDKTYCIGDYSGESLIWDEEHLSYWHQDDITHHKACRTCKCALLCGGGCTAHNIRAHHCTQMTELIKYAAKRAYNMYKQKIKLYGKQSFESS